MQNCQTIRQIPLFPSFADTESAWAETGFTFVVKRGWQASTAWIRMHFIWTVFFVFTLLFGFRTFLNDVYGGGTR